jgi:hypothetical protein
MSHFESYISDIKIKVLGHCVQILCNWVPILLRLGHTSSQILTYKSAIILASGTLENIILLTFILSLWIKL